MNLSDKSSALSNGRVHLSSRRGAPTALEGISMNHTITVLKRDLSSDVLHALSEAPAVGWDIETTGLAWDEARIATCQLDAAGVGTFVVRDIQERPPHLLALLSRDSVAKVFHHAPFDLRFMMHHWHAKPARIFCTKIASRLLDPADTSGVHSLQFLLHKHLGVEIDKAARLSDWTADVLTPEQLSYAANDVRHLVPLMEVMRAQLESKHLSSLYKRCCAFLPTCVELQLGRWPDVFKY
jgi:ribonuclease D